MFSPLRHFDQLSPVVNTLEDKSQTLAACLVFGLPPLWKLDTVQLSPDFSQLVVDITDIGKRLAKAFHGLKLDCMLFEDFLVTERVYRDNARDEDDTASLQKENIGQRRASVIDAVSRVFETASRLYQRFYAMFDASTNPNAVRLLSLPDLVPEVYKMFDMYQPGFRAQYLTPFMRSSIECEIILSWIKHLRYEICQNKARDSRVVFLSKLCVIATIWRQTLLKTDSAIGQDGFLVRRKLRRLANKLNKQVNAASQTLRKHPFNGDTKPMPDNFEDMNIRCNQFLREFRSMDKDITVESLLEKAIPSFWSTPDDFSEIKYGVRGKFKAVAVEADGDHCNWAGKDIAHGLVCDFPSIGSSDERPDLGHEKNDSLNVGPRAAPSGAARAFDWSRVTATGVGSALQRVLSNVDETESETSSSDGTPPPKRGKVFRRMDSKSTSSSCDAGETESESSSSDGTLPRKRAKVCRQMGSRSTTSGYDADDEFEGAYHFKVPRPSFQKLAPPVKPRAKQSSSASALGPAYPSGSENEGANFTRLASLPENSQFHRSFLDRSALSSWVFSRERTRRFLRSLEEPCEDDCDCVNCGGTCPADNTIQFSPVPRPCPRPESCQCVNCRGGVVVRPVREENRNSDYASVDEEEWTTEWESVQRSEYVDEEDWDTVCESIRAAENVNEKDWATESESVQAHEDVDEEDWTTESESVHAAEDVDSTISATEVIEQLRKYRDDTFEERVVELANRVSIESVDALFGIGENAYRISEMVEEGETDLEDPWMAYARISLSYRTGHGNPPVLDENVAGVPDGELDFGFDAEHAYAFFGQSMPPLHTSEPSVHIPGWGHVSVIVLWLAGAGAH
jgi:hypothetical protein